MKKKYIIDAQNFSTLEEFYEEISKVLIPNIYWGKNLDAFNDILRGGFGTPDEGFIIEWKNSLLSKEKLGFSETIRQLKLMRQYKTNLSTRAKLSADIEKAKNKSGKTVYDWIIEIIEEKFSNGVELKLE